MSTENIPCFLNQEKTFLSSMFIFTKLMVPRDVHVSQKLTAASMKPCRIRRPPEQVVALGPHSLTMKRGFSAETFTLNKCYWYIAPET